MLFADGRVGAFVVVQSDGEGDVAYLMFEQNDERWLWDEDVQLAL